MRILHVTDHYPPVTGGIESHVAALATRQALRGHDVTVLTSTPRRAEGRVSADDGPVTVVRARSLLDGRRTDVRDTDLVHAHLSVVAPFTAPVVAALARRGAPTLVTVHSLWDGLGPLPTWAAALSGLRGAPVHWSAVSRIAADQVARRVPRAPVHVLPNAVEVPARSGPRPADGTLRLVSTMRLAARKRPLELLRIVDRLTRTAEVPVHLTVLGDGPLRPRAEQLVHRRRLHDHVHLAGRVDPPVVRRVLAESDVYVAPAVLESFGLAALEARSVGLPVVGLAATGLAEFVHEGVEGLLCDDDDGLLAGLLDLVRDPELRAWISEHNRTVPSGLTWALSLDRHERVYARALAGLPTRDRVRA